MNRIIGIWLALLLLVQILAATAGASGVTTPTNIVAYLPITLTNYQTAALAPNTPLAIGTTSSGGIIGFNAIAYQKYEACNLENGEFFFSNGTIIDSWIEGNVLDEFAYNALCSSSSSPDALSGSANVLYWVNLGPTASTLLPANTGTPGSYTIYLGWAGTGAGAANTLLNGITTGEAPGLSAAYAQYDNGANVFNQYLSFNGVSSSAPTGWSFASDGGSITINNGIDISAPSSESAALYKNTQTYPAGNVIDGLITSTTSSSDVLVAWSTAVPTGMGDGWWGLTGDAAGAGAGGGTPGELELVYVNSGSGSNVKGTSNPSAPYVASISWQSENAVATINYTVSESTASAPLPSLSYPTLYVNNLESVSSQWIRVRVAPPNGIMPSTSFGGGVSIPQPTLASIGADSGSPVTVTANVSGGTGPYTYNFTIYGSAGLVANALYSSVSSTDNSFTFMQNIFWGTGSFTANVAVTDSVSSTGKASRAYTASNTVSSRLPSSLPTSIVSYLPITFTNPQNSSEPANSNLMIPINASLYTPYEANNLQNMEFFYGNGTLVPSWLEGNVLNGQQKTGLNTVNNVTYWIKIASGSFLAAHSANTIYLGFAGNSINLFDGNVVGEAPELSSGYAEYDNGNSVFALYFNGDTPTSEFSAVTGVTVSQATGVTYGSGTINAINIQGKYNCGCHYYYGVSLSQPFPNTEGIVVESNFENLNTGADQGVASIVDNATPIDVQQAISVDQGYGGAYFSQTTVSGGSVSVDHNGQGSVGASQWLYGTLSYSGNGGTEWNGIIAPQLYKSSGGYSGTLSGNPLSDVSELHIGLIGYLNAGNSNNWNEDLNWMRARVYPIGGQQPYVTTEQQRNITPSNILLDRGQYVSFGFQLQGGTGPFTVQLVESNGSVAETLAGQHAGTVTFSGIAPPVGTNEYNAIVIDNGTTPAAYFATGSNTITVEPAPTVSIALNATSIMIGQSISYTVNVPVSVGFGPFTVNVIANGNVISTNTLSAGDSITMDYEPAQAGSIAFYVAANDPYTTTPYPFNSATNTLTVEGPSTTTIPGAGGSTGGTPGSPPTTATTVTTTVTTAATTVLATPTTITQQPPQKPISVNGIQSPPLCPQAQGSGFAVNYSSINSSFQVRSSGTSCFTVTAFNAENATNTPPPPPGMSALKVINVTATSPNATINATIGYPCRPVPPAPYILANGTWNAIVPFSANAASCTVSFSIPSDPVIALFAQPQGSSTATVQQQQQQSAGSGEIDTAAAVAVVVVIAAVIALARRKRHSK